MRLSGLLLLLSLSACSDGSESIATTALGLGVVADDGRGEQLACEPLPLLQGSVRHTEFIVEDAFTITTVASPEAVRVRFAEGTRVLEEERRISRAELEADYREDVSLLLAQGARYTVSLTSECTP